MRVVVFGASGRTGHDAVAIAARRGHQVVAFVRDGSAAWFPDGVAVRQGSPTDAEAVEAALAGADAGLSAMGPIAGVTETEISDATGTIVSAMDRIGPRRIAITANAKVFTDDEVRGDFANVATEHRRDVALLRASSLAWTVIAAPLLTDEPAAESYVAVVDGKGPGRSISRRDFALALVDALDHDDWSGHVVGVSDDEPRT
jgi:putative NADH-flavin reductase